MLHVHQQVIAILLLAAHVAYGSDFIEGPPRLLKAQDLPTAVESAALQRQFNVLTAMPSVTVQYLPRGPCTYFRAIQGSHFRLLIGA